MNIALIIAGGSGNRMGQDIPKQFMYVENAPIIIHTLQCFQKHPDIGAIAVVCLTGWETVLQSYANQFSITKLKHIFPGGNSGMESIHNGLYGLNLKKGVNKIQFVVYVPSSLATIVKLYHNLNFKEVTNNVFAFKPMQHTNINTLKKTLENTYAYYAIKNNTIYTNIDPNELINSPKNDMGFFISYYGLKDGMQRYFYSNKLRFRIMAVLNTKTKNISPSIINFRITGK